MKKKRPQKNKTARRTSALTFLFFLTLAMLFCASCSSDRSGGTIDEPAITADYLRGEYADQLLRDGAEHVFGTIDFNTEEDGSIREIAVAAKEYVADSSAENGYYIADRNKLYLVHMPEEARTTYRFDGDSEETVLAPAEFTSAALADYAAHESELSSYRESRLYDIYLFDDQILLILAF